MSMKERIPGIQMFYEEIMSIECDSLVDEKYENDSSEKIWTEY